MNKKATFGAGCFWSVEDTFRQIEGVTDVAVGYAGGTTERPTYEEVCTDKTGHAEVVEVTYDSEKVSYERLLDIFWKNHNPTTMNQQGPDVGTQYRSVIFFHDKEQEVLARKSKAELDASGKFTDPIVTEITAAATFWKAEEYHQQYFEKKGIKGTCHF
jgi:peptide-methionine (S)-S-oxide reductase